MLLPEGKELHLNLEKNYPQWNEDTLITNGFEFKRFKFKKEVSLKGFPDTSARETFNNLNNRDYTAKKQYKEFQQSNAKGKFLNFSNLITLHAIPRRTRKKCLPIQY